MNVTTRRNPSLPFNNFMNAPPTLGNTSPEQRRKPFAKKTAFPATDFRTSRVQPISSVHFRPPHEGVVMRPARPLAKLRYAL
ncbi:hypothetical protein, partial [Pseudomonas gingeri]|uniref:hypothetical protein n=1 Tax=Pseudomonas gingeri TaxID=117681 RepID=UPI001C432021